MRGTPSLRDLLASALALSSLLLAGAADAQTPPSAEQLFREGRLALQQGRYDEACPKLEASQKAEPAAGTLLNLAECYEKSKRIASAYDTYAEARDAAQKRGKTEWEKLATERISALAPRLPRLRITGKIPPSATISLDGRPYERASLGKATPIDAGSHRVVVTDGTRELFSREVLTKESATAEVALDLAAPQPVPAPPAPATLPPSAPPKPQAPEPAPIVTPPPVAGASSGPSPFVWVLGGGALAAGGVGTALLLLRNGQAIDATNEMKTVPCVDRGTALEKLGKCQSIADGVMSYAPPTIAFVAGGVFAISAIALYVATTGTHDSSKTSRAVCMPGLASAACVVRF